MTWVIHKQPFGTDTVGAVFNALAGSGAGTYRVGPSRTFAEEAVMPRRKDPPEPRGVFIDRVNGWVRCVNSRGKEVHFFASEDVFGLELLADEYQIELDATDPVKEDPTPRRPSTADLRHLRLL